MSTETIKTYEVKGKKKVFFKAEVKANAPQIKAAVKAIRSQREETYKADEPCVYMVRFGRSAPIANKRNVVVMTLEVVAYPCTGCHAQPAFIEGLIRRGMLLVAYDLPSMKTDEIKEEANSSEGIIGRTLLADPSVVKNYEALINFCKNEAAQAFTGLIQENAMQSIITEADHLRKQNEDMKKRLEGKGAN